MFKPLTISFSFCFIFIYLENQETLITEIWLYLSDHN